MKTKIFSPRQGYSEIEPEIDSQTLQQIYPPCVMCGKAGMFIAPETNESLCRKCVENNDEAREKNIWSKK